MDQNQVNSEFHCLFTLFKQSSDDNFNDFRMTVNSN